MLSLHNYADSIIWIGSKIILWLRALRNSRLPLLGKTTTNTLGEKFKYRVFSGTYFPVNLRIHSEYGKIQTRKNSVFGHFSHSDKHYLLLRRIVKSVTNARLLDIDIGDSRLRLKLLNALKFYAKKQQDIGVILRIQPECGKIVTRKTPNTDTFHAVQSYILLEFKYHQLILNYLRFYLGRLLKILMCPTIYLLSWQISKSAAHNCIYSQVGYRD